jgi:UDP:flavonoid glycosyltransferase YjiC (YdhE family)
MAMTGPQGETTSRAAGAKRALLAWEFGAGRTHIGNLLGVGRHLRDAGVQCVATIYDPSFAAEFAALGIPVVQNYVWPARRRAPVTWQERPVKTLGDTLANLGFTAPAALGAAIAHYSSLFALTRPDLVIAENAPGALLAARGRLPAIAFGTGSCLPPIVGGDFAVHDGAGDAPSWPADQVRDRINTTLQATGRPPLAQLGDLLRIDGVYPFGPVEFDLYAATRTEPMLPPYTPDLDGPPSLAQGREIFVYLHGLIQGHRPVMDGLAAIERPARVYIPGLAEAERARLPDSWEIERRVVPLREILGRSRCVIHHGGPQLTSICLAAGLPQVIIPKEPDNDTSARFVAARDLGTACAVGEVTADWLAASAHQAYDDLALNQRCELAAPEFARWFAADPTRIVADAALRLLAR